MHVISRVISAVSRRTAWSEGKVFAIASEQVDFADGARAALSIGTMLFASIGFHAPDIAFGAIAALWTALCDPLTGTRHRMAAMTSFGVLGASAITLASIGSNFGPFPAAGTLFILTVLCCLTRTFQPSFGPGAAQGGFIAAIAVVIGVATPRPLDGALQLCGSFLLGVAVAIMCGLTLWQKRPGTVGAHMLVAVYSKLSMMLNELVTLDATEITASERWRQFDVEYRRAVRVSIERGRSIVARRLVNNPSYGHAIDVAARLFSALIAIGHERKTANTKFSDVDRDLLQRLCALFQTMIAQFDVRKPNLDAIRANCNQFIERSSSGENEIVRRSCTFVGHAISELVETWPSQQMASPAVLPAGTISIFSRPATIVWQHAVRVGSGVLACYLVGQAFGVALWYWGAISTLVVMQPTFGNTWYRILERATGGILGGLIAAALLLQSPDHFTMALMIVPLSLIAIAFRTVNYALFVVALTPMFLLLSDFIRPTSDLILLRLLNESVGAFVGLTASLLIFPINLGDQVATDLAAAVAANLDFAAAVLPGADEPGRDLAQVQRDAGISSNKVEIVGEQMRLEAGVDISDALTKTAQALRNVCGAATVVEIAAPQVSDSDVARAKYYEELSLALQAQLRLRKASDLPLNPIPAGDILDHAVTHLSDSVQTFVRVKM